MQKIVESSLKQRDRPKATTNTTKTKTLTPRSPGKVVREFFEPQKQLGFGNLLCFNQKEKVLRKIIIKHFMSFEISLSCAVLLSLAI